MAARNLRIDGAHPAAGQQPVLPADLFTQAAAPLDETREIPAVADPHEMERSVRNRLLSEPGVSFSSLVVRRFQNGLCLQGIVVIEADAPGETDVGRLVREVAGVEEIINQLVVRRRQAQK